MIDKFIQVYGLETPVGDSVLFLPCHIIERFDNWIFDADGTLRRCTVPGQPCPNKPDEWEAIPEAIDFFKKVDWGKKYASIVSNQGGVPLGFLTYNDAFGMLQETANLFNEAVPGYAINLVSMCASNEADHPNRKPNPGMLNNVILSYQQSAGIGFFNEAKQRTIMVGDMESDKQAAANAGVCFVWAQELFAKTD